MTQLRNNTIALLAASACMLVLGCGSDVEMAPVTGRVLYNGEPLPYGSVMFQPPQGQPARGEIQPDGTFELGTAGLGSGAVVGRNKVRVTSFEAQHPQADPARFGEGLGRSLIPEKYGQYETSGLEVVLQPNANEPLTIALTGPPPE